jgi:hypothetical protein
MRSSSLLSGLTLLAILAPAGTAVAICGVPPTVQVHPSLGTSAPRNTHVWAKLPRDWRHRDPCSTVDRSSCPIGNFDLALRPTPGGGIAHDEVPVDQREFVGGSVATVELTPRGPLRANQHYEVRLAETADHEKGRVVGLFVTGDRFDVAPPRWDVVVSAANSAPSSVAQDDALESQRGSFNLGWYECGLPALWVAVRGLPRDDATALRDMRFLVWISETAAIDSTRPPAAYVTEWETNNVGNMDPQKQFSISVGRTDSAGNFQQRSDLDPRADFTGWWNNLDPPGTSAASLRVGVRAVDLAGHTSGPVEATIPLHP